LANFRTKFIGLEYTVTADTYIQLYMIGIWFIVVNATKFDADVVFIICLTTPVTSHTYWLLQSHPLAPICPQSVGIYT